MSEDSFSASVRNSEKSQQPQQERVQITIGHKHGQSICGRMQMFMRDSPPASYSYEGLPFRIPCGNVIPCYVTRVGTLAGHFERAQGRERASGYRL